MLAKGMKYDMDKPRMDLLDPYALEGLARVLTFGANKYEPHNWRLGIANSRIIAAALRHLSAIQRGEDIDPESGEPHVDHFGCCWMFLSYNFKHRPDLDDRYRLHQPINQSECAEHSDNPVLETLNELPSRTLQQPPSWIPPGIYGEQHFKSGLSPQVSQSYIYNNASSNPWLTDGKRISERSGSLSNVEPNSTERNEHPGYYPTPFGYLNEDIAKANIAIQKEIEND